MAPSSKSAWPRWFAPERHFVELQASMRTWMTNHKPKYDCLDVFGASQKVSKTWIAAGFRSVSFDIKLNREHDLVSEKGFHALMRLGAECLG